MRTLLTALLLLSALPARAEPAAPTSSAAPAKEKFELIHVDQLVKLMKEGQPQIFDANGADFRTSNGIIPGAHLLASFRFDPATTLPADKSAPLVFYCANSH
jgi:hypothetical protein